MEPSERIDHTLVYERTNKTIGNGLYRLKIVISGNKMTELTHFVKIPESFNRRYAEMRSANTTIAWAANLIMGLLYLLGGCCFGLYWITRQRWNIIKQPLKWAILLACMTMLASINQLPFLWMHYNSAYSSNGFLAQLFLGFFINLLTQTAFLALIIMAAESLTRRAFGHHPQLWLLGKSEAITSYAVLGRTIGGYLLVSFNCAFVIGFYLFSTRYFGWWTPSEMLFDPNILATYTPWFSPIAQSLNAGFIEECLFRAIPLAGAALLGNRFGHKNWWIGCAFIVQAIVFGAAHANYPMQPSYARLIELLIPSLVFGATYLYFGLLPTIIAHCVYDIIWFSLPIFISYGPHALAYKITIVLITLFPLTRVLYARIRKGRWTNLPESAFNESWVPTTVAEQTEESIATQTESRTLTTSTQKLIIAFGILGLIAWIFTTPFTHDGVTITLPRNTAVELSNKFLEQQGSTLNAPWKTLPLIFTHYKTMPSIAIQHKFIWREGNKQLYHALLGTYLHPAHWTIRYAQFDTDIVERAEEYKIMLYNDTIWRYPHQLPETTIGAQLTQNEARVIAHTAVQEQFNLNAAELTEISATETQLPHRRDWFFIFSNEAVYPLNTGQARIIVIIAGNKVIDTARMIHVPEEWERNEQNKLNILNIIFIIFFLVLLFCLLFGVIIAIRQKKTFFFSKPLFVGLLGMIAILSCIDIINIWPSIIGIFDTSLPFMNQLFQTITYIIFMTGIKGIFFACILTFLLSQKKVNQLPNNWLTIGLGVCVGLFFAGIFAVAQILVSSNMPLWPSYDALRCSVPLIFSLIKSITDYIQLTMAFSFLFMLIDTGTKQWKMHRIFFTLIAALCGMTMLEPSLDALLMWIAMGTIIGWMLLAVYRFIIRYDYALIPLATSSFTVVYIIQQGIFNAYPGAMLEAGISACAVSILTTIWYRYLSRQN
jgi:membrane protease YdiL (CAAX protease family)